MALSIERYLEKGRRYRVLDLGSRVSPNQKLTHKQLLAGYDAVYTGVDVKPGRNVDIVMRKPYRIPVKSGSVDVVFSGQTFEHIPFPWASILEVARVLTPGGLAFITVPSRGHAHGPYDCWRYYPDGLRALAAWSRLETVEAHTDFPPVVERVDRPRREWGTSTVARGRHDYAELATRQGRSFSSASAAAAHAASKSSRASLSGGSCGSAATARPSSRRAWRCGPARRARPGARPGRRSAVRAVGELERRVWRRPATAAAAR